MQDFADEVAEVLRMHFKTNVELNESKGRNLRVWEEQARSVFRDLRCAIKPREEMDALIEKLRLKRDGY